MTPLLAPIATYVATEVRGAVKRQVNAAIGYAVAGVGGVGLLIVGLIALHRYAGVTWGPFWADAAIGVLMLAVIVGGYVFAAAQTRRSAPAQTQASSANVMAAAAAAAPTALSLMRGGRGKTALAAVAVAVLVGVLAGRSANQ